MLKLSLSSKRYKLKGKSIRHPLISIDDLGFSNKAKNVLRRNNIEDIETLSKLSIEELSEFRSVGEKTLSEILSKLDDLEMRHGTYQFKDKTDRLNLDFSVRARNVLLSNNIYDLETLSKMDLEEIKKFRNLGVKTFNEIITKLRDAGYEVGHDNNNTDNLFFKKLSFRAENQLRRNDITDIDTLSNMSVEEIKQIRNLGNKTINEIITKLEEVGYELKYESKQLEQEELPEEDVHYNFIMSLRFMEKLFGIDVKRNFTEDKNQEFLKRLYNSLSTLKEKDREVLICRNGISDGRYKTLDEVANFYNVTRERIRQIESKSIKRLQDERRSKILSSYFSINQDESIDDELADFILSCVSDDINEWEFL